MNFSRLESHIIHVMKEEQAKLGYRSEKVRLYYPLLSLNRLLDTDCEIEQMENVLHGFCDYAEEKLGRVTFSHQKERFCFVIPEQGADYVHAHTGDKEFIRDFVRTIARHGVTMEEVLQQFYRYSGHVHVERPSHGEFDYLVYFEDGRPDDFRYCITDEGDRMIYHRFTVEDYHDFYSRDAGAP